MPNGTSLFFAGTHGPLYICLHGAGHSAMSFAVLALNIKKWGSICAFDFRGHGMNKN
jgi:protein phosphatase methylesterase 1